MKLTNLLKIGNWKLKIGLIALLFFLWTNQATAATIAKPVNYLTLNTGLVGWWTFDGPDMTQNVRDRSGQGNHGNLSGQTATTSVLGKVGQALSFDAVDDEVRTSLNWSTLDSATISVWFSKKTLPAQYPFIVGGTAGEDSGIFFDGVSTVYWRVTVLGQMSKSYTFLPDTWYHIVVTKSGTTGEIFVNGVSLGTGTVGSSFASDNFNIGGANPAADRHFNGSVDDVRVYNRALSAQEIRGLYNMGASKVAASASTGGALSQGLLAHWTFDGPDMTTNLRDRSGQGNHGNLSLEGTATTTVIGKIGQAMHFDGADDRVLTSDINETDGATYLTVSAWVYQDSLIGGKSAVSKFSAGGWALSSGPDPNQMSFLVGTQVTLNYGFVGGHEAGRWEHWVWVFDGTQTGDANRLKGYLNGVEQNLSFSDDDIRNVTDSNTALVTLGDDYSGSVNWNGAIDDVRVYNRALSASEVRQLYNVGNTFRTSVTPPAGAGLTSGLVGHWTFDGPDMTQNVRDRSVSANHGNLFGQTSTTTVLGKLGQALFFNGNEQYVTVGGSSFLPGTGDLTVSLWFKGNDVLESYDLLFFTGTAYNHNQNTFVVFWDVGGGIYFCVNDGVGSVCDDNVFISPGKNDGTWHHIVAVRNGNQILAYMEGTFYNSHTLSDGFNMTGGTVTRIGGYTGALNYDYAGSIDDVRVYNRALSASEIQALYSMGR